MPEVDLKEPGSASVPPSPAHHGYIDFYGYHAATGSWLFCAWCQGLPIEAGNCTARVSFDRGLVAGDCTLAHYYREDLGDRGIGIVFLVPCADRLLGALIYSEIMLGDACVRFVPADKAPYLRDQALVSRMRGIVIGSYASVGRTALLKLLERREYAGVDTLASLEQPLLIGIDATIACPPAGLVIRGWLLARAGKLHSIRVRCGHLSAELRLEHAIRIARPDVMQSVGLKYGFADARCGFLAFVPEAYAPGERLYLEVYTLDQEMGYHPLPEPEIRGMVAIRQILDVVDVQYGEVPTAFDHMLGPAIQALNRERLAVSPRYDLCRFGRVPEQPRFSVIIPLYGRMDFLEYQLAFFSRTANYRDVELIYVLDDPSRRREAEGLVASAHERFRIPLLLVLLDQNLGYAPANNVGLSLARGRYLCFLNSDVFPGTDDWLARLGDRLEADTTLGAIGPLLLFEDGSVQHEGLEYERLPQLGDWYFPLHKRKGWRPSAVGGLQRSLAITGACLMLRRDLAVELGGYDESFIIGDFEDSDLCLKLVQRGLSCVVDLDVQLYHLERQSQSTPSNRWRMNLTLYNAWVHQRRWGETLDGYASPLPIQGFVSAS